jgi:hypothetical protein
MIWAAQGLASQLQVFTSQQHAMTEGVMRHLDLSPAGSSHVMRQLDLSSNGSSHAMRHLDLSSSVSSAASPNRR